MTYRIKAKVGDEKHIFPEGFISRAAAEGFLKLKVPDPEALQAAMEQGLFEIFKESKILDRNGNPIQVESGRE